VPRFGSTLRGTAKRGHVLILYRRKSKEYLQSMPLRDAFVEATRRRFNTSTSILNTPSQVSARGAIYLRLIVTLAPCRRPANFMLLTANIVSVAVITRRTGQAAFKAFGPWTRVLASPGLYKVSDIPTARQWTSLSPSLAAETILLFPVPCHPPRFAFALMVMDGRVAKSKPN
jgi:hypothetical protein